MIFNDSIIREIKDKSNLVFDKVGDFDLLSKLIFDKTKRTIGVTTLKRLFLYVNDERNASNYTLNTIAIFLGYDSWNQYLNTNNLESEWGCEDKSIYIHSLKVGDIVTVHYFDRKVSFVVYEQEGEKWLKVISSENSSLKINDTLMVYRIRLGEILEAEKVFRGKLIGNYKTKSEITDIVISDNL